MPYTDLNNSQIRFETVQGYYFRKNYGRNGSKYTIIHISKRQASCQATTRFWAKGIQHTFDNTWGWQWVNGNTEFCIFKLN